MTWTTSEDIRNQLERLWERGIILSATLGGEWIFPQRLKLRSPRSSEISDRFDEVRSWITDITSVNNCRITMREFKHRVFGQNRIPSEIWIDNIEDAVSLIERTEELKRFVEIVDITKARQPSLLSWIAHKPLRALAFYPSWHKLLDVIDWMGVNLRPNIYLRQVDLPGIDTKFLEQHATILTELLDIALPVACVAPHSSSFAGRYGFTEHPDLVRFRILDRSAALFRTASIHDVTLDCNSFSTLEPNVRNIFVTENKTNFLSFKELPDSMVVFGGGYGLAALCRSPWLRDRAVFYWGDIDTHGFSILNQARAHLPNVRAILMDEATLLQFESLWVQEPSPAKPDKLSGLTPTEHDLFQKLAARHFGFHVRLEQERIPWGYAWACILALVT